MSLCIEGKSVYQLYGKEHSFKFQKRIKTPDRIFTESYIDERKGSSGFDGKNFWSTWGETDPSYKSIDVISSRIEASLGGLLQHSNNGFIKECCTETFSGVAYIKITVETNDAYTLWYYLHPSSYLIEIIRIPLSDPFTKKEYINEYRYSDYRNIHGITIAFRKEYLHNNVLMSVERIRKIQIGCEVNDIDFFKP